MGKKIQILLKRNIIWILLIFILLLAGTIRNQSINIPVVSHPDTQLSFKTGEQLEQTWQSNIKKADQISISYLAETDFEGSIAVRLYEDEGAALITEAVTNNVFVKGQRGVLIFPIDMVELMPGTRYHIQMEYLDSDSAGSLLLDGGLGYMGCSIDGSLRNLAAAFNISGIKTNSISWLILTFFPYLGFAILFMVLWKRKWEETIGLSVIGATGVITFSGMCGMLVGGVYLIYFLSFLSLGIAIYLYNKKEYTIKELLSPGLFLYAVIVIAIIINCSNLHPVRADEFTHWGLSVKDMFHYDSLTKHPGTVVHHVYYPPFMPVIEYYFTYMNGFFANKFLYIAYQIMFISCLSVIYKAGAKRMGMLIPATVVMLSGLLIFFEEAFSNIYVDAMLGVFVAYTLICYFTEEMSAFNYLRILGGLLALTYTKPTGAALAGLITLIIIGDRLIPQIKERMVKIKPLILPCLSTVYVCILYAGWQFYLSLPAQTGYAVSQAAENASKGLTETGAAVQNITSAAGISISGIMDLLTGQSPAYRYETIKNFIKTFFIGDSFYIAGLWFSCFEVMLMVCLLVWLLQGFISSKEEKKSMIRFIVLTVAAGLLYIGFLLVTYVFTFSQQDALSLAHLSRYIGSWVCAMVIAFGGIVLIKAESVQKYCTDNAKKAIIFVIMLLVFITPTEEIMNRRSNTYLMEERNIRYADTLEVMRSFAGRNETIAFLGDEKSINEYNFFQYVVCPLKAENLKQESSLEDWKNVLKDCQYAFLAKKDNSYDAKYEQIFEESKLVEEGALYKVSLEEDGVILQYIGPTSATFVEFD